MLPFESEQSLGPTGDGLFLELRHQILIAQNAPRPFRTRSEEARAIGDDTRRAKPRPQ
jgi:hypothetical protein